MKKLALILVAVALCASTALAQNPLTMQLPGCDFTEFGGFVTSTEDTLWFTTLSASDGYNVAAGIGLQDYFPPRSFPSDNQKGLGSFTRGVKSVLVFGQGPFQVKPHYSGRSIMGGGRTGAAENTATLAYIYVDSTAIGTPTGPTGTIGRNKYPCQIMFSYVDSLHIGGVAAGDSVKVILGY